MYDDNVVLHEQARETYLMSLFSEDPFQEAPTGEFLWRYIPFHQLVNLLLKKELVFTLPSQQVDPVDSLPLIDAVELEFEKMRSRFPLDASGQSYITSACRLLDSLQNLSWISCWTTGGESYAMWKTFSDLEWGVCLKVSVEKAKEWAEEEGLDYGPIQYVELPYRSSLLQVPEIQDRDVDEKPIGRSPTIWFEDVFYKPEQEFRFAKRRKFHNLAADAQEQTTNAIPKPTSIPFDPFRFLPGDAFSPSGVIVAPKAPCWYVQLVDDLVGHFWNTQNQRGCRFEVMRSAPGK